jgi:hypothetical protein
MNFGHHYSMHMHGMGGFMGSPFVGGPNGNAFRPSRSANTSRGLRASPLKQKNVTAHARVMPKNPEKSEDSLGTRMLEALVPGVRCMTDSSGSGKFASVHLVTAALSPCAF